MTVLDTSTTGGLVVDVAGAPGGLVTAPGMVQYGEILIPGWRDLVGWRDRPAVELSDSPRPQAHGSYPGDVFSGSRVVTYTFMLRGTPDAKAVAVDTLERYAPLDGVERFLTVDDGTGAWFAWARVTGLQVPQGAHYRHGPVECSVQFTCADPRRYALVEKSATVTLPTSTGGLDYPLDYPLDYGTSASGSVGADNDGGANTPVVVVFIGPLDTPRLVASGRWSLGFDINLAAGESLTVDTAAGTALLNGSADRTYTITTASDPLELCTLPPGHTNLVLSAVSGGGKALVSYRDARM